MKAGIQGAPTPTSATAAAAAGFAAGTPRASLARTPSSAAGIPLPQSVPEEGVEGREKKQQ